MATLSQSLPTQIASRYSVANNTLHSTVKNDRHDLLEVEIGDSKQPIFYPRLKIKRWNNEVNFSLGLIDDPTNATVSYQGNKIIYKNNGLEAHFYDLPQTDDGQFEDGGHEFEVLLDQKPASNVLQFSIQTKGLDFFYQGELTPEEISKGAVRPNPDNITGSYAVYHTTQSGDYSSSGGNNYKTGKAFHIYRPKATDKGGTTVWCDLHIDPVKGTLSVNVPQSFLDSAIYPILIDPTFGYTTIGASWQNFGADELVGYRFTSASDVGVISKLTTYIGNGFSGTYTIKGVVVDTTPQIVTNGTSAVSASYSETTNQWVSTGSFSSSPNVSASTDYYLGFVCNKAVSFKYDTGTTNYGIDDTGNSYASPINPSGSTTHNAHKMSIYATYAPSGYPYATSITTTGFSTSVTSMPVNLPSSIVSGQLLIALVEVRNSGTWTKPTGWNDISTLSQAGGGSVGKLNGFYRIADGTEGSTATWTAGTATSAIWQVLQITNWDGTTPPEATTTSGDSSAANPPSESPSWGAANNLWIAVAGHAAASTSAWSAGPTGYDSFECDGASSGGAAVSLASAVNYTSAASEDPGAFTVSGSNRFWAAATIGVKPISAGGSAYTQACNETVTITDSRINTAGKVLKETHTLTQSLLRATTKSPFSESLIVTQSYANQEEKTFSHSFTVTDPTITKKIIGKTFTETETITDLFIRSTTKVLKETITLTQTYINALSRLFTESITISDSIAKAKVHLTNLSETITLTQTYLKQTTKLLSETITVTQFILKGLPAKTYSEVFNISKQYALTFDGSQNYLSLGTLDNFATQFSSGIYIKFDITTTYTNLAEFGLFNSGTSSLIVGFNEKSSGTHEAGDVALIIQDKLGTALKAYTNGVNISDGAKHTVVITAQPSTHTVTFTIDGVSQPVTYTVSGTPSSWVNFGNNFCIGGRYYSGTGTVGNFIACTVDNLLIGTSSSNIYASYSLNEGTGTSTVDSSGKGNTGTLIGSPLPQWVQNRQVTLTTTKLFSESLPLIGSFIKQTDHTFSESLTLTQSLIKQTITTFSESLAITDKFSRSVTKVIKESVSIAQTYLNQTMKVMSESLSLTAVFSKLSGDKVFSESFTLTDTFIKTTTKVLQEVISIIDSLKRSLNRTLSESITIVQAYKNQSIKMLSESLTLTDSVVSQIIGVFFTESVILTEKYTSYLNGVRGLWGKTKRTIQNWTDTAKQSGVWTKKAKRHG